MPTPAPRTTPRRGDHLATTDLSGTRDTVVGMTVWGGELDRRGRAHVSLTSETPTGDVVVSSVSYPTYALAHADLERLVRDFETRTIAQWDHPAGTRQVVVKTRRWIWTLGREPRRPPLIRRRRLTAAAVRRTPWTRFMIASVPATKENR